MPNFVSLNVITADPRSSRACWKTFVAGAIPSRRFTGKNDLLPFAGAKREPPKTNPPGNWLSGNLVFYRTAEGSRKLVSQNWR